MKAQVPGAAQWLAFFSCGVKTTMVLSMREKRGKSAVKREGGRGDTVGRF